MPLRVGIAGDRVHRRRPRPRRARRRWRAWRACSPRPPSAREAAARRLGAERASPPAEELVADRRRRRGARLHAQPPARRARGRGSGGRQARRLREAAGPRPRAAPSGSPTRRGRRPGSWPRCRSSTATTRWCARRAARVASGETGAVHLHPRHLPAGLAARAPRTTTGASMPRSAAPSRAFADIGSHWCDLAEFVTGHRIDRLVGAHAHRGAGAREPRGTARRSRAATAAASRGRWRPRTPPSSSSRPTAGRSARSSSARCRPGRKNRLWLEVDGARGALAFDQEHPETLWCGGRDASTMVRRDPGDADRPPRRLSVLPPGHPQGYQDCFDLFVADVYAAIRDGVGPRRAADVRRRRCGPPASPTPWCGRRASGGWVDVPAREARRWPREARVPHRLHAGAARWRRSPPGRGPRVRGARARGVAASSATARSPRPTSRPTRFDEAEAGARARARSRRHGLDAVGARLLRQQPAPRPAEREAIHAHMRALHRRRRRARRRARSARSSAAIPAVSVAENLREAERVFAPLVDHAGERGVRLMIENCVMEGWHPDGYPGNLAYSPELWEWMFGLGLWLNFDPSHLLWLGIDPVAALRPYVDRVAHAHAKDTETFPERRDRYGFFGRVSTRAEDPWDMGWWRYRIPGLGAGRLPPLRRRALRGRLRRRAVGRARGPGVGRHARGRSRQGLAIAHSHLRPLVVRMTAGPRGPRAGEGVPGRARPPGRRPRRADRRGPLPARARTAPASRR